jgi:hypothetical protein
VIPAQERIAMLELPIALTSSLNTMMLLISAYEFVNPNVVALTAPP